jgi:hypothetical protein
MVAGSRVSGTAVTTRKGAVLAGAINIQFAGSNDARVLGHWSLPAEAIERSRTNPLGRPRS